MGMFDNPYPHRKRGCYKSPNEIASIEYWKKNGGNILMYPIAKGDGYCQDDDSIIPLWHMLPWYLLVAGIFVTIIVLGISKLISVL
jgi:hypothetical protein